MYLVSACLVGAKCRYDGESNEVLEIKQLVNEGKAVPICPEQLGGLTTPRVPAELRHGRVITKDGVDVTEAFELGAKRCVEIAKICQCTKAILKAKSPSCGCGQIYDGSFDGKLIDGEGITAKLLKQIGIEIYNESNFIDEASR